MGVFLGLLGGLMLGGAFLSPSRLARVIDRDLRTRLGGVEKLHVYVHGARGVPTLKGRFESVDVQLSGFNGDRASVPSIESSRAPARRIGRVREINIDASDFVYDGVVIARARARLSGIRFDEEAARRHRQARLLGMDSGTLEINIAEAELRSSALRRLTNVIDPELRFEHERIVVTGKHKVGRVSVPFSLSGAVTVKDGRQVHLTSTDLRVSVVPVPDRLEQVLLADLNPVYVFKESNNLPFGVEVKEVTIRDGHIVANCNVFLLEPGRQDFDRIAGVRE